MGNSYTQCCQTDTRQLEQASKSTKISVEKVNEGNKLDETPIKVNNQVSKISQEKINKQSKIQQEEQVKLPDLNSNIRNKISELNPFPQKLKKTQSMKAKKFGNLIFKGQTNQKGQPHGLGTMYYSNGSVLIGQFYMGVAEGEGFFFLPDGSFYKGGIVKNKANSVISSYYSADSSNTFSYNGQGYGILKAENYQFQGHFEAGKMISGKLSWRQSQPSYSTISDTSKTKQKYNYQYEGNFDSNGKFDGKAILKTPKGKFDGKFKNGLKEGQGIFYYLNGTKYEGDYKNDLRQGNGTIFASDGKIAYSGQFQRGMPHGKGFLVTSNGTKKHFTFNQGISSIVIQNK